MKTDSYASRFLVCKHILEITAWSSVSIYLIINVIFVTILFCQNQIDLHFMKYWFKILKTFGHWSPHYFLFPFCFWLQFLLEIINVPFVIVVFFYLKERESRKLLDSELRQSIALENCRKIKYETLFSHKQNHFKILWL